MTILLRVTNADSRYPVKLTYRDADHAKGSGTIDSSAGTLAPGETKELWIHGTRALLAEELPISATEPEPKPTAPTK